jgi:hypothetical protein
VFVYEFWVGEVLSVLWDLDEEDGGFEKGWQGGGKPVTSYTFSSTIIYIPESASL